MAYVLVDKKRSVGIKFVKGVDGEGRETYASKSFSHISEQAELEEISETLLNLGSLSTMQVKAINQTERAEIEEH